MKKNLLKKVVSFAMVATLLVSGATSAFAAGSGSIEGDTDVEAGVIDIIVPTNAGIKTSINPLELKDAGSQIKTGDFVFANRSNVDVKVNVRFAISNIVSGSAITVVTDRTKVNDYDGNGDENVTTKQIYMRLVPATSMTMVTTDAAQLTVYSASPNAVVYPALTTTAGAVIATTGSAVTANADFYLKKANIADANNGAFGGTDTGAGLKGVAVMRLKGAVNPFATYAANEFKVTATYKATGIKEANYTAYDTIGADRDKYGYNVKAITDAVTTPADVAPTLTPSVATISKGSSGTVTFTYTLGTGDLAGDTVSKLNVEGMSAELIALGATYVTQNSGSKTITITNAGLKLSTLTAGVDKTITLTFANGKTATCNLTVTA